MVKEAFHRQKRDLKPSLPFDLSSSPCFAFQRVTEPFMLFHTTIYAPFHRFITDAAPHLSGSSQGGHMSRSIGTTLPRMATSTRHSYGFLLRYGGRNETSYLIGIISAKVFESHEVRKGHVHG